MLDESQIYLSEKEHAIKLNRDNENLSKNEHSANLDAFKIQQKTNEQLIDEKTSVTQRYGQGITDSWATGKDLITLEYYPFLQRNYEYLKGKKEIDRLEKGEYSSIGTENNDLELSSFKTEAYVDYISMRETNSQNLKRSYTEKIEHSSRKTVKNINEYTTIPWKEGKSFKTSKVGEFSKSYVTGAYEKHLFVLDPRRNLKSIDELPIDNIHQKKTSKPVPFVNNESNFFGNESSTILLESKESTTTTNQVVPVKLSTSKEYERLGDGNKNNNKITFIPLLIEENECKGNKPIFKIRASTEDLRQKYSAPPDKRDNLKKEQLNQKDNSMVSDDNEVTENYSHKDSIAEAYEDKITFRRKSISFKEQNTLLSDNKEHMKEFQNTTAANETKNRKKEEYPIIIDINDSKARRQYTHVKSSNTEGYANSKMISGIPTLILDGNSNQINGSKISDDIGQNNEFRKEHQHHYSVVNSVTSESPKSKPGTPYTHTKPKNIEQKFTSQFTNSIFRLLYPDNEKYFPYADRKDYLPSGSSVNYQQTTTSIFPTTLRIQNTKNEEKDSQDFRKTNTSFTSPKPLKNPNIYRHMKTSPGNIRISTYFQPTSLINPFVYGGKNFLEGDLDFDKYSEDLEISTSTQLSTKKPIGTTMSVLTIKNEESTDSKLHYNKPLITSNPTKIIFDYQKIATSPEIYKINEKGFRSLSPDRYQNNMRYFPYSNSKESLPSGSSENYLKTTTSVFPFILKSKSTKNEERDSKYFKKIEPLFMASKPLKTPIFDRFTKPYPKTENVPSYLQLTTSLINPFAYREKSFFEEELDFDDYTENNATPTSIQRSTENLVSNKPIGTTMSFLTISNKESPDYKLHYKKQSIIPKPTKISLYTQQISSSNEVYKNKDKGFHSPNPDNFKSITTAEEAKTLFSNNPISSNILRPMNTEYSIPRQQQNMPEKHNEETSTPTTINRVKKIDSSDSSWQQYSSLKYIKTSNQKVLTSPMTRRTIHMNSFTSLQPHNTPLRKTKTSIHTPSVSTIVQEFKSKNYYNKDQNINPPTSSWKQKISLSKTRYHTEPSLTPKTILGGENIYDFEHSHIRPKKTKTTVYNVPIPTSVISYRVKNTDIFPPREQNNIKLLQTEEGIQSKTFSPIATTRKKRTTNYSFFTWQHNTPIEQKQKSPFQSKFFTPKFIQNKKHTYNPALSRILSQKTKPGNYKGLVSTSVTPHRIVNIDTFQYSQQNNDNMHQTKTVVQMDPFIPSITTQRIKNSDFLASILQLESDLKHIRTGIFNGSTSTQKSIETNKNTYNFGLNRISPKKTKTTVYSAHNSTSSVIPRVEGMNNFPSSQQQYKKLHQTNIAPQDALVSPSSITLRKKTTDYSAYIRQQETETEQDRASFFNEPSSTQGIESDNNIYNFVSSRISPKEIKATSDNEPIPTSAIIHGIRNMDHFSVSQNYNARLYQTKTTIQNVPLSSFAIMLRKKTTDYPSSWQRNISEEHTRKSPFQSKFYTTRKVQNKRNTYNFVSNDMPTQKIQTTANSELTPTSAIIHGVGNMGPFVVSQQHNARLYQTETTVQNATLSSPAIMLRKKTMDFSDSSWQRNIPEYTQKSSFLSKISTRSIQKEKDTYNFVPSDMPTQKIQTTANSELSPTSAIIHGVGNMDPFVVSQQHNARLYQTETTVQNATLSPPAIMLRKKTMDSSDSSWQRNIPEYTQKSSFLSKISTGSIQKEKDTYNFVSSDMPTQKIQTTANSELSPTSAIIHGVGNRDPFVVSQQHNARLYQTETTVQNATLSPPAINLRKKTMDSSDSSWQRNIPEYTQKSSFLSKISTRSIQIEKDTYNFASSDMPTQKIQTTANSELTLRQRLFTSGTGSFVTVPDRNTVQNATLSPPAINLRKKTIDSSDSSWQRNIPEYTQKSSFLSKISTGSIQIEKDTYNFASSDMPTQKIQTTANSELTPTSAIIHGVGNMDPFAVSQQHNARLYQTETTVQNATLSPPAINLRKKTIDSSDSSWQRNIPEYTQKSSFLSKISTRSIQKEKDTYNFASSDMPTQKIQTTANSELTPTSAIIHGVGNMDPFVNSQKHNARLNQTETTVQNATLSPSTTTMKMRMSDILAFIQQHNLSLEQIKTLFLNGQSTFPKTTQGDKNTYDFISSSISPKKTATIYNTPIPASAIIYSNTNVDPFSTSPESNKKLHQSNTFPQNGLFSTFRTTKKMRNLDFLASSRQQETELKQKRTSIFNRPSSTQETVEPVKNTYSSISNHISPKKTKTAFNNGLNPTSAINFRVKNTDHFPSTEQSNLRLHETKVSAQNSPFSLSAIMPRKKTSDFPVDNRQSIFTTTRQRLNTDFLSSMRLKERDEKQTGTVSFSGPSTTSMTIPSHTNTNNFVFSHAVPQKTITMVSYEPLLKSTIIDGVEYAFMCKSNNASKFDFNPLMYRSRSVHSSFFEHESRPEGTKYISIPYTSTISPHIQTPKLRLLTEKQQEIGSSDYFICGYVRVGDSTQRYSHIPELLDMNTQSSLFSKSAKDYHTQLFEVSPNNERKIDITNILSFRSYGRDKLMALKTSSYKPNSIDNSMTDKNLGITKPYHHSLLNFPNLLTHAPMTSKRIIPERPPPNHYLKSTSKSNLFRLHIYEENNQNSDLFQQKHTLPYSSSFAPFTFNSLNDDIPIHRTSTYNPLQSYTDGKQLGNHEVTKLFQSLQRNTSRPYINNAVSYRTGSDHKFLLNIPYYPQSHTYEDDNPLDKGTSRRNSKYPFSINYNRATIGTHEKNQSSINTHLGRFPEFKANSRYFDLTSRNKILDGQNKKIPRYTAKKFITDKLLTTPSIQVSVEGELYYRELNQNKYHQNKFAQEYQHKYSKLNSVEPESLISKTYAPFSYTMPKHSKQEYNPQFTNLMSGLRYRNNVQKFPYLNSEESLPSGPSDNYLKTTTSVFPFLLISENAKNEEKGSKHFRKIETPFIASKPLKTPIFHRPEKPCPKTERVLINLRPTTSLINPFVYRKKYFPEEELVFDLYTRNNATPTSFQISTKVLVPNTPINTTKSDLKTRNKESFTFKVLHNTLSIAPKPTKISLYNQQIATSTEIYKFKENGFHSPNTSHYKSIKTGKAPKALFSNNPILSNVFRTNNKVYSVSSQQQNMQVKRLKPNIHNSQTSTPIIINRAKKLDPLDSSRQHYSPFKHITTINRNVPISTSTTTRRTNETYSLTSMQTHNVDLKKTKTSIHVPSISTTVEEFRNRNYFNNVKIVNPPASSSHDKISLDQSEARFRSVPSVPPRTIYGEEKIPNFARSYIVPMEPKAILHNVRIPSSSVYQRNPEVGIDPIVSSWQHPRLFKPLNSRIPQVSISTSTNKRRTNDLNGFTLTHQHNIPLMQTKAPLHAPLVLTTIDEFKSRNYFNNVKNKNPPVSSSHDKISLDQSEARFRSVPSVTPMRIYGEEKIQNFPGSHIVPMEPKSILHNVGIPSSTVYKRNPEVGIDPIVPSWQHPRLFKPLNSRLPQVSISTSTNKRRTNDLNGFNLTQSRNILLMQTKAPLRAPLVLTTIDEFKSRNYFNNVKNKNPPVSSSHDKISLDQSEARFRSVPSVTPMRIYGEEKIQNFPGSHIVPMEPKSILHNVGIPSSTVYKRNPEVGIDPIVPSWQHPRLFKPLNSRLPQVSISTSTNKRRTNDLNGFNLTQSRNILLMQTKAPLHAPLVLTTIDEFKSRNYFNNVKNKNPPVSSSRDKISLDQSEARFRSVPSVTPMRIYGEEKIPNFPGSHIVPMEPKSILHNVGIPSSPVYKRNPEVGIHPIVPSWQHPRLFKHLNSRIPQVSISTSTNTRRTNDLNGFNLTQSRNILLMQTKAPLHAPLVLTTIDEFKSRNYFNNVKNKNPPVSSSKDKISLDQSEARFRSVPSVPPMRIYGEEKIQNFPGSHIVSMEPKAILHNVGIPSLPVYKRNPEVDIDPIVPSWQHPRLFKPLNSRIPQVPISTSTNKRSMKDLNGFTLTQPHNIPLMQTKAPLRAPLVLTTIDKFKSRNYFNNVKNENPTVSSSHDIILLDQSEARFRNVPSVTPKTIYGGEEIQNFARSHLVPMEPKAILHNVGIPSSLVYKRNPEVGIDPTVPRWHQPSLFKPLNSRISKVSISTSTSTRRTNDLNGFTLTQPRNILLMQTKAPLHAPLVSTTVDEFKSRNYFNNFKNENPPVSSSHDKISLDQSEARYRNVPSVTLRTIYGGEKVHNFPRSHIVPKTTKAIHHNSQIPASVAIKVENTDLPPSNLQKSIRFNQAKPAAQNVPFSPFEFILRNKTDYSDSSRQNNIPVKNMQKSFFQSYFSTPRTVQKENTSLNRMPLQNTKAVVYKGQIPTSSFIYGITYVDPFPSGQQNYEKLHQSKTIIPNDLLSSATSQKRRNSDYYISSRQQERQLEPIRIRIINGPSSTQKSVEIDKNTNNFVSKGIALQKTKTTGYSGLIPNSAVIHRVISIEPSPSRQWYDRKPNKTNPSAQKGRFSQTNTTINADFLTSAQHQQEKVEAIRTGFLNGLPTPKTTHKFKNAFNFVSNRASPRQRETTAVNGLLPTSAILNRIMKIEPFASNQKPSKRLHQTKTVVQNDQFFNSATTQRMRNSDFLASRQQQKREPVGIKAHFFNAPSTPKTIHGYKNTFSFVSNRIPPEKTKTALYNVLIPTPAITYRIKSINPLPDSQQDNTRLHHSKAYVQNKQIPFSTTEQETKNKDIVASNLLQNTLLQQKKTVYDYLPISTSTASYRATDILVPNKSYNRPPKRLNLAVNYKPTSTQSVLFETKKRNTLAFSQQPHVPSNIRNIPFPYQPNIISPNLITYPHKIINEEGPFSYLPLQSNVTSIEQYTEKPKERRYFVGYKASEHKSPLESVRNGAVNISDYVLSKRNVVLPPVGKNMHKIVPNYSTSSPLTKLTGNTFELKPILFRSRNFGENSFSEELNNSTTKRPTTLSSWKSAMRPNRLKTPRRKSFGMFIRKATINIPMFAIEALNKDNPQKDISEIIKELENRRHRPGRNQRYKRTI
ncbi:hypothetical protein TNCT_54111 [Trichonephila clavata]|uniref:Uncharacterized protein n=1 Tax=Trichonephila clavata TaxID=2740835 RepID=A0A8X6HYE0_TRICU|nr:hypothetical protein TNCT_54111 [Trichonephila clavata]